MSHFRDVADELRNPTRELRMAIPDTWAHWHCCIAWDLAARDRRGPARLRLFWRARQTLPRRAGGGRRRRRVRSGLAARSARMRDLG